MLRLMGKNPKPRWRLNFTKNGTTVTLVCQISVCVPNLTQISSLATDIWHKNPNEKSAILNFDSSIILGASDPCMLNIYPQNKCDATIFISVRDMATQGSPYYNIWPYHRTVPPVPSQYKFLTEIQGGWHPAMLRWIKPQISMILDPAVFHNPTVFQRSQ